MTQLRIIWNFSCSQNGHKSHYLKTILPDGTRVSVCGKKIQPIYDAGGDCPHNAPCECKRCQQLVIA